MFLLLREKENVTKYADLLNIISTKTKKRKFKQIKEFLRNLRKQKQ